MGAWENNNDSLNLQALRQQILAMQWTHGQVASPADIEKTVLDELKNLTFLILWNIPFSISLAFYY
jgi:hypothetical protein